MPFYHNIGNVYSNLGEFEIAQFNYENVLSIQLKFYENNHDINMALTYYGIG